MKIQNVIYYDYNLPNHIGSKPLGLVMLDQ
jgi:hypothetical protein